MAPDELVLPPADQQDTISPAELFTIEQLQAHARALGQAHAAALTGRPTKPLLVRLGQSAARLEHVHEVLTAAPPESQTGSEEWLRDNFHVVQDQIREVRQHLPRRYYFELPTPASGPQTGYPRVYLLACELITHSEGRIDAENLARFVEAYQSSISLSIGELWAIPLVLRLGLVELLDRLAADVLSARRERERAQGWISDVVGDSRGHATGLSHFFEHRTEVSARLAPAFVVELLQWLRDQPASIPAWNWLQSRLRDQGDTLEEIERRENHREAAVQLAISNVIGSMRLLSTLEWPTFFERVSLVERVLRSDPAGAYARMDFPTRDRYRQSVEQLSKRSKCDELSVARQAVECANEARRDQPDADRKHHVGYYLISEGRFQLERRFAYRPRIRERHARFAFRHPAIGYLGSIIVTLVLVLASLLAYASRHGGTPLDLLLVLLLAAVPVSELAVNVINRLMTAQIPPRTLPKLALREGIPAESRTMVVVPTLLTSEERVRELLDHLEVRYIANRDPHLHFALLGDFADADAEDRPEDAGLLAAARAGVEALNERHGAGRFYFFHRARRWNKGEQRWMGWERKRGKLAEFNRLLRGATNTSFIVQVGDLSVLPSVKYVITLDSDTDLPLDAARRLVGTLAHPLNCPRLDPRLQRVTEGYGLLQPRVAVDAVSANRTLFAETFAGRVGFDPYTTASSDVYQDLFHEGSYVGKGIYHVDAFEAALAQRVPPNTLLSHDLFEGLYARVGLCTDIHLIDDYPAHYLAWAARLHRWVRGDWQILRWLWRTVPDESGRPVPNRLPIVSRWKIFDNLRRSLLPIALLLLLVSGWTSLPGSPFLWTLLALLVLAFPAYVELGQSLGSRVRGVSLRQHLRAERDDLILNARQVLLSAAFLAHQAQMMLDAVGRTLIRLLVTRRHLLQWESAADAAHRLRIDRMANFREMWSSSALAIAVLSLLLVVRPAAVWAALPLLALWGIAPELAFRTGLPRPRRIHPLSPAERMTLRKLARKTWRFFEELVGPEDHWLVPDNYQENRHEALASRSSPTNVGLQLLATMAAHDFGYITLSDLVRRLEQTMTSLLSLDRYLGHFFNWYDTRTLQPLAPLYVSTVDSGNLAGALLALKEGLREAVDAAPMIDDRFLLGLEDAAAVLGEEVGTLYSGLAREGEAAAAGRMLREIAIFRNRLQTSPRSLTGWFWVLQETADRAGVLELLLQQVEEELPEQAARFDPQLSEIRFWLGRVEAAVKERRAELSALAPWIGLIPRARPSPAVSLALTEPPSAPSIVDLIGWCDHVGTLLAREQAHSASLLEAVERSRRAATDLVQRAGQLQKLCDRLVEEMNFGFLFDPQRKLFSIGYNVSSGRLDGSYYDMLASEARLASFVAIATGTIPQEHWFKLARAMTGADGERALLSWSGSAFEYLMPLLLMRTLPNTLLDETYRTIIDRQIVHGAAHRVPWGFSESAYSMQDLELNYQYRAFGVPGLGLKRGLAEDLVVAPYASLLAAPLRPHEVVRNISRLAKEGLNGRFGLYEAVDYTPLRASKAARKHVLRTFMAHHQGMSLVAIDNCLHDNPMPARFHRERRVRAAELLLQERLPRLIPLKPPPIERGAELLALRTRPSSPYSRYTTPHTQTPRGHLLSNGSYTVMTTNAGGGYSARRDLAMTRWREDITRDAWGTFCYIRDLESGRFWSTAYQPTCQEPDDYEVTFAPDRAVFHRRDEGIELHTEVAVSSEDDAEIRRVTLTNHSSATRELEVTSYAEVVLAPHEADLAHPAFSNLFVQTEAVAESDALICKRRPRVESAYLYLVHVLAGIGQRPVSYETDRARFLGRGGTPRRPLAMISGRLLSNTVGAVLDPIVSLRQRLRLPPGVRARLSFTTAFAESEEAARALIGKYHDRRAIGRAMALAGTHSSVELRHLNLTLEEAMDIQRIATRLMYGDPRLIAADAIRSNRLSREHLWKYGISGDRPILLATIGESRELPLVHSLLKAHEYCRRKGFKFDLVVLNEHEASYEQHLQEQIQQLAQGGPAAAWIDQPGGVFLRRAALMPPNDQTLLHAVARAVLIGSHGSLKQQLNAPLAPLELPPALVTGPARPLPAASPPHDPQPIAAAPADRLSYFNGLGGFTEDGREYVIHLPPGQTTPLPWSNVVANPRVGFVATESTPGYTWSENSHENRLTPWSNDPVSDPPGEALFLRDEESGAYWSASPAPRPGEGDYVVRHGQGYTAYEHMSHGLSSEWMLFVPPEDPVKIGRLRIHNRSRRRRRVGAVYFVEWTLGDSRARTRLHVVTWLDQETQAIFASNRLRDLFGARVAFLDVNRPNRSFTCDRGTFLGRNGSLTQPTALQRTLLAGRAGVTGDPCGALQVTVDLKPGETEEIVFQLGEGTDEAHARALVKQYRDADHVEASFHQVRQQWDELLGAAKIQTPDPAMNLMLNRWLLYQTLSCRYWGRSGFYQSGGAYGFRDQLQDVLALALPAPHLARAHILKAASRQFVEGDVQHWWHEPAGEGVRTRSSDDLLWLPFATLEYVEATGDRSILDEQAAFLHGRQLEAGQEDLYERPAQSGSAASLYEHCARAIDRSLAVGEHGLPLMGGGDWNDGMTLVGHEGRGESVWLGWFLCAILEPFADVAESRGETARAGTYRAHAKRLRAALERAWDGEWYRRAYFDDGTPLGSKASVECQIDSLAQSWAVISGAADRDRARRAMEAVDRELVLRAERLVLLLKSPFDRMRPDPGYIRGYLPGVRENGGQYTHAALWVALAFARLGDGERAFEILGLLNPINQARTPEEVTRYKVEPYVVAADVYSVPPHTGRGGWTWYTGAAGWMYRVSLEAMLGVQLHGSMLRIDPCIPPSWKEYEVLLRRQGTEYAIVVHNPDGVSRGVARIELDGRTLASADVPLSQDGDRHLVNVRLGRVVEGRPKDREAGAERRRQEAPLGG